jgi:hypothetical protein
MTLRTGSDLVNLFTQNRKALLTTLSNFLHSCLTGRLKDWLPTFVSSLVIVFSYILLTDAADAVPPPFRDKVWQSIKGIILELRGRLYPMAQDLLSALSKGSKLLNMQCWNMVDITTDAERAAGERRLERNREGMRMMDEDVATFDGLRALQEWHETFGPLMRGDLWYANAPGSVDILIIASWERMFDFSPRG